MTGILRRLFFFLHHLAALLGTETEAVFEYPAEIMLRREAALFGDFPHQIRLWTQQHRPRLRQPFFVDQFAERTVDLFFDDPRQIGSGAKTRCPSPGDQFPAAPA